MARSLQALGFLIVALSLIAGTEAGDRQITAADAAAAALHANGLLSAVAAGDATKSAEAMELMTALQGRPVMSTRTLNASSLEELPTPDPATIDSLAAFFAQNATAQALLAAAAAGDEELAHLLDNPPYNRSQRCQDLLTMENMSAEVVTCMCGGELPWPHCDALLHITLSEVWSTQMPLLSAAMAQLRGGLAGNATTVAAAPAGAGASRRKLQQYMSCDGAESLFMFDPATGGCISATCEAGIYGVGSIHGTIQGCSYAVDVSSSDSTGTGQVCDTTSCSDWSITDLADYTLSSYIVDTTISGRVGVCMSVFGLQELLSWFGFSDAFCEDMDGTWSPMKAQVSIGGRVTLRWSVAGLWCDLEGRMQYADGAYNPLCYTLGLYNTWWGCQDFCNWQSGDGVLTATAGWDFLWWGDSKSFRVLSSPEYYC